MFDSDEELLRKINLGEDSVLELKSIHFRGDKITGPSREDLANELAAFANTNDGVLIIGVDDKTRDIEGIPLEKLDIVEKYVEQICTDSIVPPLSVKIIRLELPNISGESKPILKIDIPRSLFVHKSSGGYFRRHGSTKREIPPDQLARLFQQRSQARIIRFDEQPVPDSSINNLEEIYWKKFVRTTTDSPIVFLEKMRLLVNDDNREKKASVSGILLCSKQPEQWLPNAFIQAVRYRGIMPDGNYQIDAQDITGPLDQQIINAVSFVKKNMTLSATKEPGRKDIPQFSLRAVFEAIVNAVAHRDYSIHGSKIRLFIFNDRLELYSPGALPNTLTIESISLRQSTRNELITSLLAKCPVQNDPGFSRQYLMDKRGEGVPIILNESEKLSGKKPLFRLIDDSELLLTIFSAQPGNASVDY